MKKLLFTIVGIVLILVIFLLTRKTDKKDIEEHQLTTKERTALQLTNFNDVFVELMTAVDKEDMKTLNKYVHPKQGYYFILSGEGVYQDYIHYDAIDSLYEYSETASEFEANPFKDFLDLVANLEQEQIEIFEEDLFDQDRCGFEKEDFTLDSNTVETTVLSDIYRNNVERNGEKLDAEELIKLRDIEVGITKRVFIGDGEQADVFFFSKIDGKWYLTIVDMRDCGS